MHLKLNDKSILRRPWLLLSIAVSFMSMVFIMMVFNYVDGNAYISWSVELLDCIFRKTTTEFYEYSGLSIRENLWYVDITDKTIPMLLPLAIWNIPVWIAHEITGNPIVTGFTDILWMKTGFILCIVIIAVECSKIVKTVAPEADHLLVYPLVFASFDIVCSTMYACQDEIIYLLMLVIALRFILQKRIVGFLIFSSLSVILNVEMMIPVLIMIVFFEKRVSRVLIYTVIAYIPTEVINLLNSSNETLHDHTLIQPELIQHLFEDDVALSQGAGNASLFLFVICILLFFTYTLKKEESDEYDLVWIMTVLMISRTLLSSGGLMNFFYRSLLYVPFAVVLVVSSKQDIRTNIILYGLYSWCRGWLCILSSYPQNMSMNYLSFDNEHVQRVLDKNGWVNLGRFAGTRVPVLGNYGIITVACLSLATVLLFINYRKNLNREYKILNIKKDILVLISGMFLPLVVLGLLYMYKKADVYSKTVDFGSSKVLYCEQVRNELEYGESENSYIHTFPSRIVYEDNICLDRGEDRDGVRYIYPDGGLSFGPYIRLYPGEYEITIRGKNLDNATCDVSYSTGTDVCSIPVEDLSVSERLITYQITVDQTTDNVETRVFNWSHEQVLMYSINIQQIR